MITQDYLKTRLQYDPLTGIFTWKLRPGNERTINSWNARYAGKEAGTIREINKDTGLSYNFINLDGKICRAHRLAWFYEYGVGRSGRKYRSRHFTGKVDKSLGSYNTVQDAHKAWQEARATQIEVVVAKYATQSCFRADVAEALTQRVWKLRLDAINNEETKSI
jgi:hypothetical protein